MCSTVFLNMFTGGFQSNLHFYLCVYLSIAFCTVTWSSPFMSEVEKDGFNFLVIGDWGGLPYAPFRTQVEQAVADRMGKIAATVNAKFVIALGDNFYYDGVADDDDDRFEETYEDVYTSASLHVPWYIVAGNHDHHRNVSAQVAYSRKSKRWNFPDLYYTKVFKIPSTSQTLQLIMIDTVVLCGNTGHDDEGNQPKGPRSMKDSTDQLSWLEKNLNTSKADFIFVGGHYPVWSISKHGPTHCLLNKVKPLLEKYRVTAYLAGHDHNLQHLKEDGSVVEYFVSGCANFIDGSTRHAHSVPEDSCKFFWADEQELGGLGIVNVKEDVLTFSFLDSAGNLLYEKKMASRNQII